LSRAIGTGRENLAQPGAIVLLRHSLPCLLGGDQTRIDPRRRSHAGDRHHLPVLLGREDGSTQIARQRLAQFGRTIIGSGCRHHDIRSGMAVGVDKVLLRQRRWAFHRIYQRPANADAGDHADDSQGLSRQTHDGRSLASEPEILGTAGRHEIQQIAFTARQTGSPPGAPTDGEAMPAALPPPLLFPARSRTPPLVRAITADPHTLPGLLCTKP
jgi:hypothetical protein